MEESLVAKKESAEPLSKLAVQRAVDLYPMSRQDRGLLTEALGQGRYDSEDVRRVYEQAVRAAEKKLSSIGLTLEQYHAVYQAFTDLQSLQDLRNTSSQQTLSVEQTQRLKDLQAAEENNWNTVRQASEASREGIGEYLKTVEILSTKEQHVIDPGSEVGRKSKVYNHKRRELHAGIVKKRLQACEAQQKPKIIFLIGPPGGGKSSAREQLTQNFVSTDPDSLRAELYGDGFDPTDYAHTEATHEEAYDVTDLIFEEAIKQRKNILFEGTGADYEGYLAFMQKCEKEGYEVELKFVYTPPGECLRRSMAYRDRAVPLPFLLHSLGSFYTVLKFATAGRPPIEVIHNGGVLPRKLDSEDPKFLEELKGLANTYIRE